MLTALEASVTWANADRGLSAGGIGLKGLMALALLSYVLIILFPQPAEPMTENAFNPPTAALAASAAACAASVPGDRITSAPSLARL